LILFRSSFPVDRIELRAPVIFMVLAATAIPIELRPPTYEASGHSLSASLAADVLANILGYVPVGIVLRDLGRFRAVATAAGVAIFAETAQLVMAHRDASIVDVLSNVVGAGCGVTIACHWRIPLPALAVSRWKSQGAAVLAAIIVAAAWISSADPPSARGMTLPGRLEAYWKLDENSGRIAKDWSGNGHNGRFSSEPNRIGAASDQAVVFDGAKDYVDLGSPSALRLVGSMTVSAWIKSTSYPVDDAAIVSGYSSAVAGYQLDTTVDRGPRTVSLKIADECGTLAARYGATPLVVDTWYHVAGVYNSEARTLSVYLDGILDDGFLLGSIPTAQHSSRSHVYIGRRSDAEGFEFAGAIRDVRVYSRALTAAEIVSDMRGNATDAPTPQRAVGANASAPQARRNDLVHAPCAIFSDHEDVHIPVGAAALGLLVAAAGVGFWPSSSGLIWLVVGLAAGALLPCSALPPVNSWIVPLASLAGSASAVVSMRRAR
jgi:VanZ family protein